MCPFLCIPTRVALECLSIGEGTLLKTEQKMISTGEFFSKKYGSLFYNSVEGEVHFFNSVEGGVHFLNSVEGAEHFLNRV